MEAEATVYRVTNNDKITKFILFGKRKSAKLRFFKILPKTKPENGERSHMSTSFSYDRAHSISRFLLFEKRYSVVAMS